MKRLLIILVLIILIAIGGYLFFVKTAPTQSGESTQSPFPQGSDEPIPVPETGNTVETGTEQPGESQAPNTTVVQGEQGALRQISKNIVTTFWFNKSTNSPYYTTINGEIYEIGQEGEQKKGAALTSSIKSAQASAKGDLVLIEFSQNGQSTFSIFNISTGEWKSLPAGVSAATWSPNETTPMIAYIQNGGLYNYNPKTSKAELVIKTNLLDVTLSWKQATKIYIETKPSTTYAGSGWVVDTVKKTIQSITANRQGLITSWSSDGGVGIRFTSSITGKDNLLALISDTGTEKAILPITTLPQKCIVEKTAIYCAKPADNSLATKSPEDYLQQKTNTNDEIIKLDIANELSISQQKILPIQTFTLDAWGLQKNGNTLYFMNRADGYLYSLNLQQ